MSDMTYTTAQVHFRLGVPKPTIRNWSAEYAQFLSERAHPGDHRIRLFTQDDLIVLNTVRYYTRVEGLNNNQQIHHILETGQRVTDLPAPEISAKRQSPVAVDLGHDAEIETERDQALIALDEANQRVAALREAHGHLRGVLAGITAAGVGLALLIGAGLIVMAVYLVQVQR